MVHLKNEELMGAPSGCPKVLKIISLSCSLQRVLGTSGLLSAQRADLLNTYEEHQVWPPVCGVV
jgi:hypothetical protein